MLIAGLHEVLLYAIEPAHMGPTGSQRKHYERSRRGPALEAALEASCIVVTLILHARPWICGTTFPTKTADQADTKEEEGTAMGRASRWSFRRLFPAFLALSNTGLSRVLRWSWEVWHGLGF